MKRGFLKPKFFQSVQVVDRIGRVHTCELAKRADRPEDVVDVRSFYHWLGDFFIEQIIHTKMLSKSDQ